MYVSKLIFHVSPKVGLHNVIVIMIYLLWGHFKSIQPVIRNVAPDEPLIVPTIFCIYI